MVHLNAPREDIFSLWRQDFFVLRDFHSQHVYVREESLPHVLHLKPLRICPDQILYSADNGSLADRSMADKNHGKLSS